MGLGAGTNEGIQEQNEQQLEDITGEFWTPIEDLNTPGDAREYLTGDTNVYSQEGTDQSEVDQEDLVDEATETLSDPELNSNLEPEEDLDPDDYEQPGSSSQSNGDDDQLTADDLPSMPQMPDVVPVPSGSSGSGGQSSMMTVVAVVVAAVAAVAAVAGGGGSSG